MNYDEMSDHDVNMRLTRVVCDCKGWCVSESNMGFYHCGVDGSGFYEVEVIDYCNSWADIGPLIDEHDVAILPMNGDGWDGAWRGIISRVNHCTISECGAGPKRAAAICIIKLLESK